MTRLRKMQAEYYDLQDVTIPIGNMIRGKFHYSVELKSCIAFKSYDSVCAIYDKEGDIVYLLPRWDYSVTTLKQLRAFVDDVVCGCQFDIKKLRKKGDYWSDTTYYIRVAGFKHKYSNVLHIC